jgi:phospholipase/carboxylesterase/glyoxalase family protein
MAEADLKFIHRFIPATAPDMGVTLLLLHGTGGNENDLLELGSELLPGAAMLSPRGRLLEGNMPRFFRRFAEGVFDIDDLKLQTHALHDFALAAAKRYGVPGNRMVAVGYSNGANIAASLLLLHPELLSGAILFRGMVPLTPDSAPDLKSTKVLVGSGKRDPIIPYKEGDALAKLLASFGAEVEAYWDQGGHELGMEDVMKAQNWLRRNFSGPGAG